MLQVRAILYSLRSRRWVTLGVVLLGLLLRVWAALMLPIDADEPVYLAAGYDYAQAIRAGDLDAVIDYPGVREHPALVKLLYAGGWLALGPNGRWQEALAAGRAISVFFGTLSVLLLALLDPLAGALLAVHTMTVKYTAEVYLEAAPQFAAIAAVLALCRARATRKSATRTSATRAGWFWLSAAALGLTAAGKFTYVPVLFPIMYLALWERPGAASGTRRYALGLLAYLAVAVLIFVAFNPTLWRAPVQRLVDALFFHVDYSHSLHVQSYAFPWYQPVLWAAESVPWHPEVFFYPGLDGLILWLALAGIVTSWQRRRWATVWLLAAWGALFLWPTKWPQYTLIFTPALCILAADAARQGFSWLRAQEGLWDWLAMMRIRPPKIAWVIAAIFIVYVVGVSVFNGVRVQLERLNWTYIMSYAGGLPDNTIHDLLLLADGRIAAATESGLGLWTPAAGESLGGMWQNFDAHNSPLPHSRALALAQGADGALWIGVDDGLAMYDGAAWRVYRAADMGVARAQVWDLAFEPGGALWAATASGAARFAGGEWTAFTTANSGLAGDFVRAVAVADNVVYLGGVGGVSAFDSASGAWRTLLSAAEMDLGKGVSALLVDAQGQLWAGTLGRGLGVWDGAAWKFYRASGKALPHNTITTLAEAPSGQLWVGGARAAEPGGAVAVFDGAIWRTYTASQSGYLDAEPLSLLPLPIFGGRATPAILIGTRALGIALYQPRN